MLLLWEASIKREVSRRKHESIKKQNKLYDARWNITCGLGLRKVELTWKKPRGQREGKRERWNASVLCYRAELHGTALCRRERSPRELPSEHHVTTISARWGPYRLELMSPWDAGFQEVPRASWMVTKE